MFTLVVNAPDFASRAKKPSAAVWPQLISMPLGFTVTSFLGIVIASASAPQFGTQIWDVVQVRPSSSKSCNSVVNFNHRLWTECLTVPPHLHERDLFLSLLVSSTFSE